MPSPPGKHGFFHHALNGPAPRRGRAGDQSRADKVAKASNGEAASEVRGNIRPPRSPALILRKLKEAAEAYLADVTQAFSRCPLLNDTSASDHDAGRSRPRRAADHHERRPPRWLGLQKKDETTPHDLAADLDISTLEIARACSRSGDQRRHPHRGDDFDQRIRTGSRRSSARSTATTPAGPDGVAASKEAAERRRRVELDGADRDQPPFITADAASSIRDDAARAKLESLVADLVARPRPCRQACRCP